MHDLPYWRLSGYYFFYFAFVGAFSPYFGLYLQSLSFSAWDIGLLMSQMQLMRLCAPYIWGALSDRLEQRVRIVRLAALLSLFGFLAFFVVQSFVAMLAAMALLAFFWSAALPLVETVTFDHLRDKPGQYSRIRLWGSIGFIVAVMGTGALLDSMPLPRLLWVIVGTLAGILVCALVVPEVASYGSADEQLPVATIIRQARVRALFAACFLMSAAHGSLYVFYSIHLTDHHYSKLLVGGLWSLGVLAEIGVFFFMVAMQRSLGLRVILLISFAATVLRFLMIGWCIEWLAVIILAQLLHGLTFGAYHAAAIAAVNRWFPGRCQARGQALYSSISFGAGGLLGSLLSGWTWDRLGAGLTYTLSSVFAAAGLIFVVLWVKRSDLDDACDIRPLRIARR
ncbi:MULTISPECIES: MFS transporter [Candidatus Accumulibacter]|uniref:3-phenylpropionic acid transporter n=2 Tax=Candidatus Accumulibacter TaxID=327159 RepID=A0A080M4P5_9PROT|nr:MULTISPECIES: MFS transporter [Candidatus Accumulibacter]KFB76026.1 MAG: putative 3-phenylpropionic acid transporter [Candidatus Accumulibacter cognatus]TMQ77047.1 Nucleoside:H+ symporter:Major facilitator superfamily [Candidatus Accumulibacter phosphatis]